MPNIIRKPAPGAYWRPSGLVAAIETCPEIWSNRLLVTELWIDAPFRKQGLGHALMEVAKKQALREHRRAVILETQSCNVNAVDFYLHEGFTLIGLDSCCYGNNDLARKEVRLNLGWFPPQKAKPSDGETESVRSARRNATRRNRG